MPGNLAQWNGIYFVHRGKLSYNPLRAAPDFLTASAGPYASAVLRFHVNIPTSPSRPPIITLRSEVFHPLVTPVTTHLHAVDSLDSEKKSTQNGRELPPGGLSIVPGFPIRFSRNEPQVIRRLSVEGFAPASENAAVTENVGEVESGSSAGSHTGPLQDTGFGDSDTEQFDMVKVLEYIKVAFEDECFLDTLSMDVAVNAGAWKAWQAHRGIKKDSPESLDSETPLVTHRRSGSIFRARNRVVRAPGEWSWEGVWADRVAKNVEASISKPVLYGRNEDDSVCSCYLRDAQSLFIDTGRKVLSTVPRFQQRSGSRTSEQAFARLTHELPISCCVVVALLGPRLYILCGYLGYHP